MNYKEYWVIATFEDRNTTWCKKYNAHNEMDLYNRIEKDFEVREHDQFIILNEEQARQVKRDLTREDRKKEREERHKRIREEISELKNNADNKIKEMGERNEK